MLTRRNADHAKWQRVAAMLHDRHTANHCLAVRHGCQSSWSAFRLFDIPTHDVQAYKRASGQTFELLHIGIPKFNVMTDRKDNVDVPTF